MGTVKSRINRGRAQISKKIGEYVDMGTSFDLLLKGMNKKKFPSKLKVWITNIIQLLKNL